VGAAVAGPIGVAMGATLGGLFSEQAAKLLETYAHAGGEALSELGVHYFYDQLREASNHPPLECVVQQSLRLALEDVRRGLPLELDKRYADWFANWDSRLSGAEPSAVVGPLFPDLIPSDIPAQERALDQLFQRAMERLDGEARASKKLSITSVSSFRTIPGELLHLLVQRLPTPLQAHFDLLIALPEHQSAWIAVQQNFQDDVRSTLAKLDSTTHRTEAKMDRILEIQERELSRALEAKEIAEQQACDSRAKAEEYEKLYCEALKDAAARTGDPDESRFADLLAAGDLEGAAALKTKQIESRKGEVKKLARDWSELGRVHDLRFAWDKALECYREAWRLDPTETECAFRYAYFAQQQNRFAEAVDTYLQILPVLADPADVAATLNNLANICRVTQRMREAEQSYLEALAIYRHLARPAGVATTLNNLGIFYRATRRMSEAEQSHHEALRIRRHLAEANPEAHLPDYAVTLNNLALVYRDRQKMNEAEQSYQEALTIYERLADSSPGAYLPDIAATQNNLANLYNVTQRTRLAEGWYQKALTIYRRLAGANPEAYMPNVAGTLNNLANMYNGTQRIGQAEQSYYEALGIYRRLAEGNPQAYLLYAALILNNLAVLCSQAHNLEDAEKFLQEALTIRRRLAADGPEAHLPDVAITLSNLAHVYSLAQRTTDAETCCGEARAILEPLWQHNPELHGDQFAKINLLRAQLAGPERARETRELAR
jgi:tetratricopeptide (TPR) repeat protein